MKIRYDYFIIWGHGIKYSNEIINKLEKNKNFEIKYFYKYTVKNLNKFISNVYFNDYSPILHLKNKTQYLKGIKQEVLFIFVKNINPKEIKIKSFGKLHIESKTINSFKKKIRNKFNPRIGKILSQNHVIHGSDCENQTRHICSFLSNRNLNFNIIFDDREYLNIHSKYVLKYVYLSKVKGRIFFETNNEIKTKIVPLNKTPHFKFLDSGKKELYEKYILKFRGVGLNKYYSVKKFKLLKKHFKYLNKNYENNYIEAEKIKNNLIITDGLHRATILKQKKIKKIIIKVKIY